MTHFAVTRACAFSLAMLLPLCSHAASIPVTLTEAVAPHGIEFSCSTEQLSRLLPGMSAYLKGLGAVEVRETLDRDAGTVRYSLVRTDPTTLGLSLQYQVQDELVTLPALDGQTRQVSTVSKKEILLALLNPGRLTTFAGPACELQALVDHVGVRQNIVAWAEVLEWGWPEGGPAKWNPSFWQRGTPHPARPLHSALNDMFFQQDKYEIGCYTATKVVYSHAVLDYFVRVKKDSRIAGLVEERLLADGEPLVNVEPGKMWFFESDFDPQETARAGKVLQMTEKVGAENFVPGDWVYFLNTDAHSYQKTGYEGSNAIYLGRNKFDDYYNDNHHSYTYQEKLGEVYQWRHGVFSRIRDAAKVEPLTAADYTRLGNTPDNGGLLLPYRVAPHLFGYSELPAMPPANPS